MALPDLSNFDAGAFGARLKELLPRRPDGSLIRVWETFPEFVRSLRAREDATEAKLGELEARIVALEGGTPPPPPPPPPTGKFAPRTHNWTTRADARFCMKTEFGVRRVTPSDNRPDATFVDSQAVFYDEGGRDLGGRSNGPDSVIPELKGADSMDGLEACDPYTGPTGVAIGGAAGYPARSFTR